MSLRSGKKENWLKNVQIVDSGQKRMKVVIIWHVEHVHMNGVGYAENIIHMIIILEEGLVTDFNLVKLK